MLLWIDWFWSVLQLRGACARKSPFMWIAVALVGFSIRNDLLGVTSFVRSCFLSLKACHRLLHLFHSPALELHRLTELWVRLVLKLFRR